MVLHPEHDCFTIKIPFDERTVFNPVTFFDEGTSVLQLVHDYGNLLEHAQAKQISFHLDAVLPSTAQVFEVVHCLKPFSAGYNENIDSTDGSKGYPLCTDVTFHQAFASAPLGNRLLYGMHEKIKDRKRFATLFTQISVLNVNDFLGRQVQGNEWVQQLTWLTLLETTSYFVQDCLGQSEGLRSWPMARFAKRFKLCVVKKIFSEPFIFCVLMNILMNVDKTYSVLTL